MISHVFRARRSINDRTPGPVHIMMLERVRVETSDLFVRRHSLWKGDLKIDLLVNNRKMKIVITHVRPEDKLDIIVRFGTGHVEWYLAITKPYHGGVEEVRALHTRRLDHAPTRMALRRRMFLGLDLEQAGSNRYVSTDDGYESDGFNDHELIQQIRNTEQPI
jgi:hypothetical protein